MLDGKCAIALLILSKGLDLVDLYQTHVKS